MLCYPSVVSLFCIMVFIYYVLWGFSYLCFSYVLVIVLFIYDCLFSYYYFVLFCYPFFIIRFIICYLLI